MGHERPSILDEIEAGERWLARVERTRPPSAEALERTRKAVRESLARQSHVEAPWRAWHGAIAAAAMILLTVGIAQYARWSTGTAAGDALSGSWIATTAFTEPSIDDDMLDELSNWQIGESWALSGSTMYDLFEDAFNEDIGNAGDAEDAGAQGPATRAAELGAMG